MELISGVLYKEEQNLPGWVYLLFFMWVPFLLILPAVRPEIFERMEFFLAIFAVLLVDLVIIGFMGKLTVLVKWNEMIIQIGFFKVPIKRLKKTDIKSAKVVDGNLWKIYGGWGIRTTFGATAYIYSGGGGVEIELEETSNKIGKALKVKKIVVTSKNPARLMDAIMSMS